MVVSPLLVCLTFVAFDHFGNKKGKVSTTLKSIVGAAIVADLVNLPSPISLKLNKVRKFFQGQTFSLPPPLFTLCLPPHPPTMESGSTNVSACEQAHLFGVSREYLGGAKAS